MSDEIPISERIEKAPWWVPCVLCFFAGAAIPFAVLMTQNATPDYQRGHTDGVAMGRSIEAEDSHREGQRLYQAGINEGRRQIMAEQNH